MRFAAWIAIVLWSLASFCQAVPQAPTSQPPGKESTVLEPPSPECRLELSGLDKDSVADQVSLYYFGGVTRLMKILNPATREIDLDKAAAETATAQRKLVATAEMRLRLAQADVNKSQRDLEELEEKLRQSEAQVSLRRAFLDKSTLNLNKARQDQARASSRVDKAQRAADSTPNDPASLAALDRAQEARENADRQAQEADSINTQAKKDHDDASAKLEADQNNPNGLARKIEDAKAALETAQKAVANEREQMLLHAADEVQGFARARDNAPYWCAAGNEESKDPAQRVTMFGFDDSKIIFLRGRSEDVQKVESIIAQFDRPSPQSRLTLWTLELNSDATQSGTDKLNRTLKVVEEELADTRVRLAGSISALRDAVLKRLDQPDPSAAKWSRAAMSGSCTPQYLRKVSFYDHELMADLKEFQGALPDPAVVTTLGESLITLTLARKSAREAILAEFRKRMLQEFPELRANAALLAARNHRALPEFNEAAFKTIQERSVEMSAFYSKAEQATPRFSNSNAGVSHPLSEAGAADLADFQSLFPATMRALGLPEHRDDNQASSSQLAPSPQLAELKQAFRRVLVGRQLDRLSAYLEEAQSTEQDRTDNRDPAQKKIAEHKHNVAIFRLITALNSFKQRTAIELGKECGVRMPSEMEIGRILKDSSSQQEEDLHTQAEIAISCLKDLYPARYQNAREAAANEMLKQLIVAFEDDLDRHYVRPMVDRIRERVNHSKGVSVGIIQRTSLLATNRLLARVDPRGSAQLGVGQEQDILGGVQQLAQLFTTAQTLGPAGLLPALQAQPRKPDPELYAVNTGAEFKVTPIFDPSGQALRFKLDYLSANRVQEPSGTTNPQLSRVERHTINTEVQLSNMELREVTRFEADAAVGIPTRKRGGIPILNEIPVIRDVPLIGYFVRKAGKNAVMQESIIFGQTTTYPTISDLLGLEMGNSDSPKEGECEPVPKSVANNQ